MKYFTQIKYCLIVVYIHLALASGSDPSVQFLEPGEVIENQKPGLQIFCHNAKSKLFVNVWRTLILHLRTNLETYEIYDGKTPGEVREKHEYNQKSWKFNFFDSKRNKMFKINPFEDSCIGIYTHRLNQYRYEVTLIQLNVDHSKVMLMVLGIIIFWYAQHLSKNTLFYYICGILLGVTTSILILIYFVSKLLPRGKFMYLTAITGYTMSVYIIQMLWDNSQLIAKQYQDWVIYYILATSAISFIVCYRFGPVTNERTQKIIQWFLQGLALACVYNSSYFVEASTAFCVLLVFFYNFPRFFFDKSKTYWKRMFPERRKLLSEDQYREEAMRETGKALEELKEFCASPECNTWKMVLKLKDPVKFAKFIEGDSHLSEDEAEAHDNEITELIEETEFTDDEDCDF